MPKVFCATESMDDMEGLDVIAHGMSPWARDQDKAATDLPPGYQGNEGSSASWTACGRTQGACIRDARDEIHEAVSRAMHEGRGRMRSPRRRKPVCLSPILITSPILSPTMSRTSSAVRSPMRSPIPDKKPGACSPRMRSPMRSPLPNRASAVASPRRSGVRPPRVRSPLDRHRSITSPRQPTQFKKQVSLRSHSLHDQADKAMEMVEKMRNGLLRSIKSTNFVLTTAQQVVDQCGEAIFLWFGNLSGPALETAIQEAFDRFDTDSSKHIDKQEFSKAMHALGMRLKADDYDVLFREYDADQSGEIDLAEFTHMIKKHIRKACHSSCKPCEQTGGSNQPGAMYRYRWAEDEALLAPAARKLQSGVVTALARQNYADLVAQKSEHNGGVSSQERCGPDMLDGETLQMKTDESRSGAPGQLVENWNSKLPPSRYPAGASDMADDKASQDASDASDASSAAASNRPSSNAEKEIELEAEEEWKMRQEETWEKRRNSLDGEVEAALAAFDKAAQAASAEGGSAKGSVVATVELLRPAVCGVWHKTNEKWEGGPMSSLGGEPHDVPTPQPSHRRFERTNTAKHANSPLNQVKAFNSKVLQSVQSSDSFSLHEKTLRPVRHSLEAEPLNNVKSTRKFSLDGFLDICKSRSGVVSSGAYTDRTGEGRKTRTLYWRATEQAEAQGTEARGAGSRKNEAVFFSRAASANDESAPALTLRDKRAVLLNRSAHEVSAPFLPTLTPRARDSEGKLWLPAIGDKSDRQTTLGATLRRNHSDEGRPGALAQSGTSSKWQSNIKAAAPTHSLLSKQDLHLELADRKSLGRVFRTHDDMLVLAKCSNFEQPRRPRCKKLQTPW